MRAWRPEGQGAGGGARTTDSDAGGNIAKLVEDFGVLGAWGKISEESGCVECKDLRRERRKQG